MSDEPMDRGTLFETLGPIVVTPLPSPVGKIFYVRFRYSELKNAPDLSEKEKKDEV